MALYMGGKKVQIKSGVTANVGNVLYRKVVYEATPETLADIITNAQPNTTIYLTAGDTDGNYGLITLVPRHALNRAEDTEMETDDGNVLTIPALPGTVVTYPENLTIVGCDGVTMEGICITSGQSKEEFATSNNPIWEMPSNLTIKDLTLTDSIRLRNCTIDGLNFLNCTVTKGNIQLSPDSLKDSQYGTDVTSNTTAATVWHWPASKPLIRNVIIDNCILANASTDSKTSAIIVSCVDNLAVTNNEIKYAAYNAIQVNGQSEYYSTGRIAILNNIIRWSGSRSIRIASLKNAELFMYENRLHNANQTDANDEYVKVSDCKNTTYTWMLSKTSGPNYYRDVNEGIESKVLSVGDGITLEDDVNTEWTDDKKAEVIADVIAALPVYNGEVV